MDGMGILDNFEAAWDIGFEYESSGLNQAPSEICTDGCTCQSSKDHKPE
jgi:hypothetical protein